MEKAMSEKSNFPLHKNSYAVIYDDTAIYTRDLARGRALTIIPVSLQRNVTLTNKKVLFLFMFIGYSRGAHVLSA